MKRRAGNLLSLRALLCAACAACAACAVCVACSLTTSLDGYAGAAGRPEPDSSVRSDGEADAASDVADASIPLAVTSLALVATETAMTVPGYEVLVDGTTLPKTPARWTLRAQVNDTPGSVTFAVDGTDVNTENNTPYYMCGDNDSGVIACTLDSGPHVVEVTPRTLASGAGAAGTSLRVKLNIP